MQYYRTIERTFEVGAQPELRVANRSGELTIVGEDRADIALSVQIAVEADSQRDGEARLDQVTIPMDASGDAVEIGPPEYEESVHSGVILFGIKFGIHGLRGTRVDMRLRVPRSCAVQAMNRSGPLRLANVQRGVRLESRSGRLEVTDVTGDLSVDSRSGSTEVRNVNGKVTIDSRSGKVELEGVTGDVRIQARSGVAMVRSVRGSVTLSTRSGKMQLEDIGGAIEATGHSGMFEYRGRVNQSISVELQSGAVRLGVTSDSSFYMDAETRVGSIRSELPVNYLKEPEPGAPTVRVRTHAGSIRIVTA